MKRTHGSRAVRRATAVAVTVAAMSLPAVASAETTAWMSAGGGVTIVKDPSVEGSEGESFTSRGTMPFDVGVGTEPDGDFIVGGLFRLTPVFQEGVDVALVARGATWGFQSGWFGLALDAGGYARGWGAGSTGFTGQLVAGGPFGLQLAAGGMVGTNDIVGFTGTLSLDLLRLTLFRKTMLDWWPNPSTPHRDVGASRPGTSWAF